MVNLSTENVDNLAEIEGFRFSFLNLPNKRLKIAGFANFSNRRARPYPVIEMGSCFYMERRNCHRFWLPLLLLAVLSSCATPSKCLLHPATRIEKTFSFDSSGLECSRMIEFDRAHSVDEEHEWEWSFWFASPDSGKENKWVLLPADDAEYDYQESSVWRWGRPKPECGYSGKIRLKRFEPGKIAIVQARIKTASKDSDCRGIHRKIRFRPEDERMD